MSSMAIDRRHFLIGGALVLSSVSSTFAGVLGEGAPGNSDTSDDVTAGDLIAACRRPDGSYSVVILTLEGEIVRELPLKERGHDIALDRPSGWAVVFARRPGSFGLAFDVYDRRPPVLLTTSANRHFYGHGVFSRDGRLLYGTEHDNATRQGLLGIYDVAAGFKRIGEMPTHGIGPHEVILLEDGKTLAVANGGIETHVETGRQKLNVDTMVPSLAFLDAGSGALLAKHEHTGALHKLSIRHIAADARGTIWFGAQWEGETGDSPELIGCADLDKAPRLIEPGTPRGAALVGYIGAVAIDGGGRILAASAPRAGRIVYIDTERGSIVGETLLQDSCGLTGITNSAFASSSGLGVLQSEQPDHSHLTSATFPGRSFDNHLRMII
jgi:hypothetical protein